MEQNTPQQNKISVKDLLKKHTLKIPENLLSPEEQKEFEEELKKNIPLEEKEKSLLMENIKVDFLDCLKLNENGQLLIFKHPDYGTIEAKDYKNLIKYLACKGLMKEPDLADLENFNLYTLNSSTYACQKEFHDKIKNFNKNHLHFGEDYYGQLVDGRVKQREAYPKNTSLDIDLITTHQSYGKDSTKLIKTSILTSSKLATNRKQKSKNNLLDPFLTPLTPNYEELIKEINASPQLLQDHNPWLIENQSVPFNRYRTDRFGYDCYWPVLDNNDKIINHEKFDEWILIYLAFWQTLLPNTVQYELWLKFKSKTIWQPGQIGAQRCPLIPAFYDHDGRSGKTVGLDHWTNMTKPFSSKITDANTVFGQNNARLENKMAIFLDEAPIENSSRAHSAFKNLATANTLDVQDKYIKTFSINNHAHTTMAYNRTDKNIVGQNEGRLRIFDIHPVEKKKIKKYFQARQEINFDYCIAQYLKKEYFIPHKISEFITPDWENLKFAGEMYDAKKMETDYGRILYDELRNYSLPENFIEAYQYLIPEIKQPSRKLKPNSLLLTRENLTIIFGNALKKNGINNHHAKAVHITQVIKELREKYLPEFKSKPYTRAGKTFSYYNLSF